MHGLQLEVEDMAHCVAAYHFSCLLDEIIALRCASVPGKAADIRLADASIQCLGFVMFSRFIPTCLPVDALYEPGALSTALSYLQAVSYSSRICERDNALTILVCYTPYTVSTE